MAIEALLIDLGIADTAVNKLYISSAVEWLNNRTTFEIDVDKTDDIPNVVKLFMLKFTETMQQRVGVASESIEGLSHSYRSNNFDNTLYELAIALFGVDCLKSTVKVMAGESSWEY